ncbi:MAG: mechanosensitive ion channel family protein [bacterium]|nr:mechanosensitive ion channel family protein [bacterium]
MITRLLSRWIWIFAALYCLPANGWALTEDSTPAFLEGPKDWVLAHFGGTFFFLQVWQWVALGILVFMSVVLDRIVRVVIRRTVQRLMRARDAEAGQGGLRRFERPWGIWAGTFFFRMWLRPLDLTEKFENVLQISSGVILAFVGVWAVYGLVDVMCDFLEARAKQSRNKFDDMFVPLFRRTLKIIVVIGSMIFLATKWTDDLWSIVAGLGLGSVAIAFAARDSVENLFGTFTVLLDKPFAIGDWITMGKLDGDVESVGFRSTRVRTFYNSIITVPNRHFISGQVDNMGARRYRRIKATLGLTYDTPPEKVEAFCEGIRELIRNHPHTRKNGFHVYLNGMGASSLDILLYCFVEVPDWSAELAEKHRLLADILRLAKALEVDFAFPTQSLHMVQPEDVEHGNVPKSNSAGLVAGREAAAAILKETSQA